MFFYINFINFKLCIHNGKILYSLKKSGLQCIEQVYLLKPFVLQRTNLLYINSHILNLLTLHFRKYIQIFVYVKAKLPNPLPNSISKGECLLEYILGREEKSHVFRVKTPLRHNQSILAVLVTFLAVNGKSIALGMRLFGSLFPPTNYFSLTESHWQIQALYKL